MKKILLFCGFASLILLTMPFVSAARVQTEEKTIEDMKDLMNNLHSLINNEKLKYWAVIIACFVYYAFIITYFSMK